MAYHSVSVRHACLSCFSAIIPLDLWMLLQSHVYHGVAVRFAFLGYVKAFLNHGGNSPAAAFEFLSFQEFPQQSQSELKEAADEALDVKSGKAATFTQSEVQTTREISLELRTPIQILTAAELKSAMGRNRLPTHMNSVPTLELPAKPGGKNNSGDKVF